jgi:hypothetical protein
MLSLLSLIVSIFLFSGTNVADFKGYSIALGIVKDCFYYRGGYNKLFLSLETAGVGSA